MLFTHMLQGMLHSMLNHVGSIWEPHAFYMKKTHLALAPLCSDVVFDMLRVQPLGSAFDLQL